MIKSQKMEYLKKLVYAIKLERKGLIRFYLKELTDYYFAEENYLSKKRESIEKNLLINASELTKVTF
jgi:hypothetical protein